MELTRPCFRSASVLHQELAERQKLRSPLGAQQQAALAGHLYGRRSLGSGTLGWLGSLCGAQVYFFPCSRFLSADLPCDRHVPFLLFEGWEIGNSLPYYGQLALDGFILPSLFPCELGHSQ